MAAPLAPGLANRKVNHPDNPPEPPPARNPAGPIGLLFADTTFPATRTGFLPVKLSVFLAAEAALFGPGTRPVLAEKPVRSGISWSAPIAQRDYAS